MKWIKLLYFILYKNKNYFKNNNLDLSNTIIMYIIDFY